MDMPAALGMALSYHRMEITKEELTTLLGTSDQGTKHKKIIEIAKELGFKNSYSNQQLSSLN